MNDPININTLTLDELKEAYQELEKEIGILHLQIHERSAVALAMMKLIRVKQTEQEHKMPQLKKIVLPKMPQQ